MRKKTELFIVEKILADKTLFDSKKKQIDVLNSLYSLLLLWFISTRQKFVAGEQSLKGLSQTEYDNLLRKETEETILSGRIWH
jgi:hypothetical protein